jgi:hypothetical protein
MGMAINKWLWVLPNPRYSRRKYHLLAPGDGLYTVCGLRTFADDCVLGVHPGDSTTHRDVCKVCAHGRLRA